MENITHIIPEEIVECEFNDSDHSDKEPDYIDISDNVESDMEDVAEKQNLDEPTIECLENKKSRKRKRCEPMHVKMTNLKNRGKAYKTKRGKFLEISEKVIGEDCNCKRKCYEQVNEENRNNIFKEFWSTGDYNIQNNYLQGCMVANLIKRRTSGAKSRRKQTISYTVRLLMDDSDKAIIKICKNAFLGIHGLQNNRGRLENIVKTFETDLRPILDGRGKHSNHPKKYSKEDIEYVKKFIDSLPRYESHNGRKNTLYTSLEYPFEIIYKRYCEKCSHEDKKAVSSDKFRRIFTETPKI